MTASGLTDEQLAGEALTHLRRTSVSYKTWEAKRAAGAYRNPGATEWGRALALLDRIGDVPAQPHVQPHVPVGFGSKAAAGVFAGRGIMLGGNRDVWDQARGLARDGYVDVVAIPTNQMPEMTFSCRIVTWVPPELEPCAGGIHQAEKQTEWDAMIGNQPSAIVLNSWTYGRFPAGSVALVELYANEGWGIDFGVFKNYSAQGAAAVIPVCGGYPAAGRTNAEAAAIYAGLDGWSGGVFPGKWMYAGEDLLTDECVAVMEAWKP